MTSPRAAVPKVDYLLPPEPRERTGTFTVQSSILDNLHGLDLKVLRSWEVRPIKGTRQFQKRVYGALHFRRQTRREALLHITSYYEAVLRPFARNKTRIVSVFDVIPYLAANHLREELRGQEALGNRSFNRIFESIDRFDFVFALSEWTRRDIAEFLHVSPKKIGVVYPGVDPTFRALPDRAGIRRRLGLTADRPYLVYAGAEQPRKNLATLLDALSHLKRRMANPPVLIKLGPEGWKHGRRETLSIAKKFGVEDLLKIAAFVPQHVLVEYYNAADLMVYPTLYEGFGLPPLEAMSCGLPVVTTAGSSLPEVTGNAALVVRDPLSATELADLIEKGLTDDWTRGETIRRGHVQAAKFTWANSAASTRAYYQRIWESSSLM